MTDQEKLGQALLEAHKQNPKLKLHEVHDIAISTATALNANSSSKS